MLVICEDCAKKYEIDVSKIKGEKAYFPCKKCNHQIVVNKPVVTDSAATGEGLSDSEEKLAGILNSPGVASLQIEKKEKGRGIPVAVYFILPLLLGFLVVNGTFAYLGYKYIPELLYEQVNLRSSAITSSFYQSVQEPLKEGNFLQVAKSAELISKIPDVAYVAVVNEKGVAVVGLFGEINRFDLSFYAKAKKSGFPVHVLKANTLGADHLDREARLTIGGQSIHDKAVKLPEINGELHVGIFVGSINKSLQDVFLSPVVLAIMIIPWVSGLLAFFLLARYITTPLKDLTAIVHRLSLGELDLTIEPHGPRELRDFSRAFERMRYSIREAINRLKTS